MIDSVTGCAWISPKNPRIGLTKNKPKAEILLLLLLIKTIIYLKSLNLCKINVMLSMLNLVKIYVINKNKV